VTRLHSPTKLKTGFDASIVSRDKSTFITNPLGEAIDVSAPRWLIFATRARRAKVNIHVALLDRPRERGREHLPHAPRRESMYSPLLTATIRGYLADCARRYAPLRLRGTLGAFLHFERYLFDTAPWPRALRVFELQDLRFEVIDAYRRHCERSTGFKGTTARELRNFYRWGVRGKVSGFERRTFARLRAIKFQSRLSGHITRFRDPTRGAFSWEEREQIELALRRGVGDPYDRAVVALFHYTGMRPEAAILLQRRHLEVIETSSGPEYALSIPRVKQRGLLTDRDVVRWTIRPELGELLLSVQREGAQAGDRPLLHFLAPADPSRSIARAMQRWADAANLLTTRVVPKQGAAGAAPTPAAAGTLATRLHLFPYRFRRTIATILAEHGGSVEEVAALLDDKTLAMAAVYVENSPNIVDLLEETLDRHPEWVRVISMFRGEVASQGEASLPGIPGGAPHLADYEEFADIGAIGHCASDSACAWEPPLSCYMCEHFRATPDPRPHERQLIQLRREIDRSVGRETDRMAGVLRRNAAAIVELLSRLTRGRGGIAAVLDRIRTTRTRGAGAGRLALDKPEVA
jgi:hypothetical protein